MLGGTRGGGETKLHRSPKGVNAPAGSKGTNIVRELTVAVAHNQAARPSHCSARPAASTHTIPTCTSQGPATVLRTKVDEETLGLPSWRRTGEERRHASRAELAASLAIRLA